MANSMNVSPVKNTQTNGTMVMGQTNSTMIGNVIAPGSAVNAKKG